LGLFKERECCLLVLNLVSFTLPCIRHKSIKFHKSIHFNIYDDSKDNVELLILNILESVKLYPREFLFINNKDEQYTEKGLQTMLYKLVPDKNIGINALRSIYIIIYQNLIKIK
jgi:hypothetical protein